MTKKEFTTDVDNWSSYLPLLYDALKMTNGKVVEFGCGAGSTEKLRSVCKTFNREFLSYENNPEYANKYNSQLVTNWDEVNLTDVDVLFIDHAPGERRIVDIEKYANIAKLIVIHDTEEAGYSYDKIWHLFNYRKDDKSFTAHTTLVSNFIEL